MNMISDNQSKIYFLSPAEPDVNGEGSCFLQRSTNGVEHRVKRPALLVSSTSWTGEWWMEAHQTTAVLLKYCAIR